MKYIITIIIALLFTGCITQKKCNEKFPPQVKTEYIEKIKDTIIYKYIDVPVYIKGDTVHESDTVYIKNGIVNSKPVSAETDFAKAVAQVFNSKLYLDLYQKDTTFNQRYDSVIKESHHWRELYENRETVREVKIIPRFYKIMSTVGLILSVGGIVALLYKFKILS